MTKYCIYRLEDANICVPSSDFCRRWRDDWYDEGCTLMKKITELDSMEAAMEWMSTNSEDLSGDYTIQIVHQF